MTELQPGAVRLPHRHLSARVPWHDTGWGGGICSAPSLNSSCIVLDNIRSARDDEFEDSVSGSAWRDLEHDSLPPCVDERAGFMRSHEIARVKQHPYAHNPSHQHLTRTTLTMPAHAVMAVPFRWMLRGNADELAETHGLEYRQELEDQADEHIRFDSAWVQDGRNQRVMLDSFFSAIQPERSLLFLYAKSVPLIDDVPGHRVLIGAARVSGVGPPTEWAYDEEGPIRTWLWERAVHHTLRPDFQDGFLLPYHALLEELGEGADLSPFVAMAPADHWNEFSYASEHVTHDGAIASLLQLIQAVEQSREHVAGPWSQVLAWCDERLNEIWKQRGPAPGLGSALNALGLEKGTIVANRIIQEMDANEDPWLAVERALAEAADGRGPAAGLVGKTQGQLLASLPVERRQLLELLSRFSLGAEQARRLFLPERRSEAGIDVDDRALLTNPYLLYELDRGHVEPVTFTTIDRGVFPDDVVRSKHPLPVPEPVEDAVDARRVRALAVSVLEERRARGDTVVPRDQLLRSVQDTQLSPACPLTSDLLPVVEDSFAPVIVSAAVEGQPDGYQLDHVADNDTLIRRTVEKRLQAPRHQVEADWGALFAEAIETPVPDDPAERDDEIRARAEKATALEELAASRFSVLLGPAGTGKTTLLRILAEHPAIAIDGVLLLAPTGKARVQLQEATKQDARTIAQFLLPSGRYDPDTGIYRVNGGPKAEAGGTVIIDEASMLTEDQLAATIDALAGTKRLILVGDPRQLPPIGAGRPFVDIVERCRKEGKGYAELTVHRRQVGSDRTDLDLAAWFTSGEQPPGSNDVWAKVAAGDDPTVSLRRWDDESQLEELLFAVMEEHLGIERGDPQTFAKSLGANVAGGYAYYNLGCAATAESWQILAPMRGRASGVTAINRLLQRTFKAEMLEFAQQRWSRIPRPLGDDEIVYGDKVICVRNHQRSSWSPGDGRQSGYIANGEIGIAVGQFRKGKGGPPRYLHVEFGSQAGRSYSFSKRDFSERGDLLELAYATTVHKSQGSQFGTTILILPNPSPLLSPELLYTALTRQQDRVIVLHQGDISTLKPFTAPQASETARRLTNLFAAPAPTTIAGQPLDANLVHRTSRGDAVRSKSEVIIANLLHARGIDYAYEYPFQGADGSRRYPDFTIEDDDAGVTYLWEHLGMLHVARYRRAWERKLEWYQANGVLPHEEGGGERATLLTTRDSDDGHLDSSAIDRLVTDLLI